MAKVIKKAQDGFAANLLKKKAASDTTKMYDREEFINNINKRLKTPNAKSSSSKETISNFSDAEIKKAKAASKKKAQDGLRTGQYKRLGRIDEKNPARAERVADRMNTRATRVSRGKDIASPSIMRSNPMMNMKLSLERDKFEKDNSEKMQDSKYTLPPVTVTSSRNKQKFGGKIIKKAQKGVKATADSTKYYEKKSIADARKSNNTLEIYGGGSKEFGNSQDKLIGSLKSLNRQPKKGKPGYDANGFPVKKAMKAGGMLKRADGSYSKRGLWDNIRANKGSGKKPTAAMLKQEKKIKAKTK